LHFRTSCESLTLRLLRPTARAGKIQSSQRRWNAGSPIDMTTLSHIAVCLAPDLHVRGVGMGNAMIVDQRSPAVAAVFGGRATT
jgi:hypothetical protein